MATIVLHKDTGQRFVLVGTAFGTSCALVEDTSRPWAPATDQSHVSLVAASDADGVIHWFPVEWIRVIDVDGKPPNFWLNEQPFR